MASNSLISFPFLSEIVKEKRRASMITQMNICNALGFGNLDGLLAYGRAILEAAGSGTMPLPLNNSEIVGNTVDETTEHVIDETACREFDDDEGATVNVKNVVPFPKNGNYELAVFSHEKIRLQQMHENLDAIFQSGDIQLIAAIESNLIAFKKTVDLQKRSDDQELQTEALKQEVSSMRDQIRNIIGGTGG